MHRAPSPNYNARRIGVAALAVLVVGVVVWFFFLRGDGEPSGDGGDGDGQATTCEQFREDLLAEYKPMVGNMRKLITALAPVDAGEEMTAEQIAAARAQQDTAQAHYDAIDALPTPPEELKQDFVSLRPTLNEFVALSGRTIEWLEGTEPAKPTDTPSEQLQALLDSPFLPKPAQITACP